jgi:hypothetical protein
MTSPNPAIITTYRGPTDSRGSRIVVSGGGPRRVSLTVPYDHALSAEANHAAAAAEFVQRRHGGPWAGLLSADLRPGQMAHAIVPDAT